ncbi:uncharacterized protein LOC124477148 isoform X1 [Hypomesus transpacificus]|nr:uncharacterized protein LOC124477148 isoform X1 [Hypomesus transpacificus]
MPQVPCLTCNTTMPLQMLALHAENCQPTTEEQSGVAVIEEENEEENDAIGTSEEQGVCPICQEVFPTSVLPLHASVCAERSFCNNTIVEPDMEVPGPSSADSSVARSALRLTTSLATAWKTADTPLEAMRLFLQELRQGGEHQPSLLLSLDARDDDEERDSALVSFYKEMRQKSQWTAPFKCRILGDAAVGVGVARHTLSSTISKLKHGFKLNLGNAAVTTMFEGQTDHLVPALSAALIDSDLFLMAGRMIGHSAIHGGPTLSGLSLAVVDSLRYGSKETATSSLCLEDCSDIDHRETIGLLLKEELGEEESSRVTNLCLEWYFPVPTKETNRLLLFQQLLSHAVLGRSNAQIKQIRKGLKDTGIWPLLACRPDVAPLLFPRESVVKLTSQPSIVQLDWHSPDNTRIGWQMVLESITWPPSKQTDDSDNSDSEISDGKVSLISGFLRTFVEEASPDILRQLLKFWVGWEVPSNTLKLEIVNSCGRNHLPTSSTCYERLRISNHYTRYSALKADLIICLQSVESGFGLV